MFRCKSTSKKCYTAQCHCYYYNRCHNCSVITIITIIAFTALFHMYRGHSQPGGTSTTGWLHCGSGKETVTAGVGNWNSHGYYRS